MALGRPTKYDPDYHPEHAYKFALLNCTDVEIAKLFNISQSTLNLWKLEYPKFSESLNAGKDLADARVAESLYGRATGYKYIEKQPIKVQNVDYEDGKRVKAEENIEVVEVEKEMPADVRAAMHWLKNRRRDTWSDRQNIEFDNLPPIVIVDDLSKA